MRLSGWYRMCLTCEEPGVPWIWLLSNMWSGCTGCENQNCRSTGSRGELVSPSDPSLCLDSGWDEEMWVKLNKTTFSLIDHPIHLTCFWRKLTLFISFALYLLKLCTSIYKYITGYIKNQLGKFTFLLSEMGVRVHFLSRFVWRDPYLRESWLARRGGGLADLQRHLNVTISML